VYSANSVSNTNSANIAYTGVFTSQSLNNNSQLWATYDIVV